MSEQAHWEPYLVMAVSDFDMLVQAVWFLAACGVIALLIWWAHRAAVERHERSQLRPDERWPRPRR